MKHRRLFGRYNLLLITTLPQLLMIYLHLHQYKLGCVILHRKLLGTFTLNKHDSKINLAGTHNNELELLLRELLNDIPSLPVVFGLARPDPAGPIVEVPQTFLFEFGVDVELFAVEGQLDFCGFWQGQDAGLEDGVDGGVCGGGG